MSLQNLRNEIVNTDLDLLDLVMGKKVDLFKNMRDESRALFDMAAVAIVKNPSWADAREIPGPKMVNGTWMERPDNARRITLWENFDKALIMQDFYFYMENYVLATAP